MLELEIGLQRPDLGQELVAGEALGVQGLEVVVIVVVIVVVMVVVMVVMVVMGGGD